MKLYSLNHQGCPCLLRSGTKPVFNHSMLNHTVSAPSAGSSPTPPPTSNSSKSIQDVVEQLWRRTLLSAENPQQCFNPEEKNDDMIKIYFYSCLPWPFQDLFSEEVILPPCMCLNQGTVSIPSRMIFGIFSIPVLAL